jgi:cytosine/adenosine deaminase-related metal-dependent hydrolase
VSIAAAIEDEAYRKLGPLAELALTEAVNAEILRTKLEMLAAGVTAFSNVESHAAIVVERARRCAEAAA